MPVAGLSRVTNTAGPWRHPPVGVSRQLPVPAPALVVHGTSDPLLPLPHGQAVAALIPGARLATVPGMGHGFFSPGLPAQVARLILGHTAG